MNKDLVQYGNTFTFPRYKPLPVCEMTKENITTLSYSIETGLIPIREQKKEFVMIEDFEEEKNVLKEKLDKIYGKIDDLEVKRDALLEKIEDLEYLIEVLKNKDKIKV